jgi:DNA polymerase-3 subunit beta
MPVLGSVLLTAKKGTLILNATDLDTSITIKNEIDIEEEGGLAVSEKELIALVKELPKEEIEFSTAENILTIKCKKSRFTLPGIASDEFPAILTIEAKPDITLSLEQLKKGIDKVSFATSTTDPSSSLRGILFDLHKDGIILVATDGHKMAMYKTKQTLGKEVQAIISPNVLKAVSGFSSETIDVALTDNKIGFYTNNTIIVSRLFEGGFPPYKSVIPTDSDKELNIAKKELLESIKRTVVFAPDISSLLKFKIAKTTCSVESASEVGEAKEEVLCKYKGTALEIGFNGKYVESIINKIDTDKVIFKLTASETAIIINPEKQEKDEELTYLLMPIRLT